MPVQPITTAALQMDLSSRIVDSVAVVASPAAAAETIIASVSVPLFGEIAIVQKVYLTGWAAFTVGTNGTAVTIRLRQTNVTGTIVSTTGAVTGGIAAANLCVQDIAGSDATPGVATYVMTMQVTAGSAASTVSAVQLLALVV